MKQDNNEYGGRDLILPILVAALVILCALFVVLLYAIFNVRNSDMPLSLEFVDRRAFEICQGVAGKEPFKYYRVVFMVRDEIHVPAAAGYDEENRFYYVYLHSAILDVLDKNDLETLVAHELGHIYLHDEDQKAADYVASAVLGNNNRVRDFLIRLGLPADHPRIMALKFPSPDSIAAPLH